MMPSIKKKLSVILMFIGLFLLIQPVNAQIPDEIITSLKTGNAKVLSGYFNQNVELVVPESDNAYSKAQAQLVVNDFFSNHPPTSFTLFHQGGKEGNLHVIGTLGTQNGNFRVNFLLRENESKYYILLLRIEKQEEPNEKRVVQP